MTQKTQLNELQSNEFPALITALRARLGFSQERLADALHVAFSTVNRWESGKSKPTRAIRDSVASYVRSLGPKFKDLYDQFPNGEAVGEASRPWSYPGRVLRKVAADDSKLSHSVDTLAELGFSIAAIVETMSALDERFTEAYGKHTAAVEATALTKATASIRNRQDRSTDKSRRTEMVTKNSASRNSVRPYGQ